MRRNSHPTVLPNRSDDPRPEATSLTLAAYNRVSAISRDRLILTYVYGKWVREDCIGDFNSNFGGVL